MTARDTLTEAEWLAWRRSGITATDVADAANDTYGGAYGVVARKLELVTVEQTDVMDRGHRWQAAVADAVHALTGYYVVGEEACVTSAENEVWLATVDGFLTELIESTLDDVAGVLEVKTRGVDVWPNRARWRDQVQWQLLVAGYRLGLIAEAIIDDSTDTCRGVLLEEVVADPYRQAELVEVARDLWAHVQANTLPAATASSLAVVKDVHGPGTDPDILDLDDLADELYRLRDVWGAIEAAQREADRLEALTRDAIGQHLEARAPGVTVKLSAGTRKIPKDTADELVAEYPDCTKRVLDTDRFKKQHPAEYEAARRPAGGRRLTITSNTGDTTE